MNYRLSVIVPSIRPQNLEVLYRSIKKAFHGESEMIVVGPYKPPELLHNQKDVVFIEDWGSPVRAQQRGLIVCRGDYVSWASDDGQYTPYALDIAFGKLALEQFSLKTLVMGKYREGDGDTDPMVEDKYYYLANHDGARSKFLDKSYLMLNVGLVPRELLIEYGGWDCRFEACPYAYNDLANRLQNNKIKFIIQNEIMFTCSHLPGIQGDHAPIHYGQTEHDEPLFKKIYGERGCEKRGKIDLNNWESSPARWERRFGRS